MKRIVVPIITVHRICNLISTYIDYDELVDLINAYIKQFDLNVELAYSVPNTYSWEILVEKIDEFPDVNKLDFIGQVFDAGYITYGTDVDFIESFLKKYNFQAVHQELFERLVAFSSDAIKAQKEFSERLENKHPSVLRKWNSSIEMMKSKNYSEAGEDMRQALEFLLRDILRNTKSIEKQLKQPNRNVLKSELGKYLKDKNMDKANITFISDIATSIMHMANDKFKHGEPINLTYKDIRFYMNETYLIMQQMLDIAGE